MTPAIGAILGGGVFAAYLPILRNQIRDGEIGIPLGTINPLPIRRDEHPVAFRVAAIILTGLIALLLVACVAIFVRSLLA